MLPPISQSTDLVALGADLVLWAQDIMVYVVKAANEHVSDSFKRKLQDISPA